MMNTKYLVQTIKDYGDGEMIHLYFDTEEEARAGFTAAINNLPIDELYTTIVNMGKVERSDDYIYDDYLDEDEWWTGFYKYDEII